ncbi:MAG: hypothetical protein K2X27_28645 [Candidatus Obscuribacterales bacterium]|nr:hypothetical protein [Candidatus Obscuribacterales bacterium]
MKRRAIASGAATSLFLLACCQTAFADDELFPNKLFQNEDKPLFSDSNSNSSPSTTKEAALSKTTKRPELERANEEMRNQIQRVAGWLREFSLRNQNRFPGVYGDANTIGRASRVQLTELAGANPYKELSSQIKSDGSNELSSALFYSYFAGGSPTTVRPLANDEWTAELTAENANRINLQMDRSASNGQLTSYRDLGAPSNWEAAPGTITACGNGQGFLYVWGAGADGKPVKDSNGKPYIVSADTGSTLNDQVQQGSD